MRDAELDHDVSERRLAAAPRLHRRGPRHERDQATDRLTTPASTSPTSPHCTDADITRYDQAVAERNTAADAAHAQRTSAILDRWSLDEPTARDRLQALDTWHAWASGEPVHTDRLIHAADILDKLPDSSVAAFLCHQLERSLPTRPPESVQHVDQSIGIDLDF